MKFVRVMSLLTAILAMPLMARADEAPASGEAPAAPAAEEVASEKEWSGLAGFDYWTLYVFRGVNLTGNDGMFNPWASISWKGFTGYYWGAYSNYEAPGNNWYEEADLGIEYSHGFFEEKLTLTGGMVWYLYPDGDSGNTTVEFYGKAALPQVLLKPYVSLYWDVDEFDGAYLSFGCSHSFDLTEKVGLEGPMSLSIDPSAQLSIDMGYNNSNSDFKFNDLLLGVRVPWRINERIEVHAGVQISIAMDSLNSIGQGDEIIGNVGASYSF